LACDQKSLNLAQNHCIIIVLMNDVAVVDDCSSNSDWRRGRCSAAHRYHYRHHRRLQEVGVNWQLAEIFHSLFSLKRYSLQLATSV